MDSTLLRPEATDGDVRRLCTESGELGVLAVCVSPSRLPLAADVLPAGVRLAVVCGFPSGAHRPEVKAHEACLAIEQGADEIDMVVDLGAVKEGRWAAVRADVAAVRGAVPAPAVLKVICESALLSDDELVRTCREAEAAGADFVKTSTGFSPAGGAQAAAVRLMARTVGDRLGVKASGGIRTPEAALAMVAAGATRLGVSAARAILDGLPRGPVDNRLPAASQIE
ncbi:MAG: deoxyribose-phosphate aldolase [Actinomycetota bacterium]|nr:deoxyribose-phosphate aldolase [Actinomycetota bacterium]